MDRGGLPLVISTWKQETQSHKFLEQAHHDLAAYEGVSQLVAEGPSEIDHIEDFISQSSWAYDPSVGVIVTVTLDIEAQLPYKDSDGISTVIFSSDDEEEILSEFTQENEEDAWQRLLINQTWTPLSMKIMGLGLSVLGCSSI